MLTQEEAVKICRGWTPQSLALFYEWIFRSAGFKLPAHMWPVVLALCDSRILKLMLIIGPGSTKALQNGTPVLTTRGWVPIEETRPGDQVVLPNGTGTASILVVSPQPKSRLYRLTFADGRVIYANADHLWKTHNKKFDFRDARCKKRWGPGSNWRVCTTQEIAKRMKSNTTLRWYMPLTQPVQFPKQVLPVDPYVLGCLLGDGHFYPAGFTSITCYEPEILRRIISRQSAVGLSVSTQSGKHRYGMLGLATNISGLKLGGARAWNKFIPEIYKTGSIDQRLELLRGLLDTDGGVASGHIMISTASPRLASDIQELVWSLGGTAKITTKPTSYRKHGVNHPCRMAYQVSIRYPFGFELFHLTRKAEKAAKNQYAHNLKLHLKSIELMQSESDSTCISIADPEGLFITENYVVTHNSQLTSVCWPAFVLGHDPTMTIIGISAGEALMQGFQQAVMDIVEFSEPWKHIFPNVKPDKESGWSSGRGMFVTGRTPGIPDANYWCGGLTSRTLPGKHGKTLIIDDIHNDDNSQGEEAIEGVVRRYYNTILGRADPMQSRFILSGRRWHTSDIYGRLGNSEEWVVMTLPAEREGKKSLWFDISVPDNLECVFTDYKVHCFDGQIVDA